MDIDDATVITAGTLADGYGLELIGRRIWQLIQYPTSVNDLCDALIKEYDVNREACEQEVIEFLEDAVREQVVEVSG